MFGRWENPKTEAWKWWDHDVKFCILLIWNPLWFLLFFFTESKHCLFSPVVYKCWVSSILVLTDCRFHLRCGCVGFWMRVHLQQKGYAASASLVLCCWFDLIWLFSVVVLAHHHYLVESIRARGLGNYSLDLNWRNDLAGFTFWGAILFTNIDSVIWRIKNRATVVKATIPVCRFASPFSLGVRKV